MKKRVFNLDDFIQVAQEKFGTKFDYSKFVYVTAKTKSLIGCPTHGYFEQCSDKHLQSKHGCPICGEFAKHNNRKQTLKKPCREVGIFLSRFTKKHGESFDIDLVEYVGLTKGSVTVTCKQHGTAITDTPHGLMARTYCCADCARINKAKNNTKSFDSFINEATTIHKVYSYPDKNRETFVNRESIVSIICPIHGEYTKRANKHLGGQGCKECAKNNARLLLKGGYNETYFETYPSMKDANACVYYVKVGNMYKIGITTNVKNRLSAIKSKSKLPIDLICTYETTLFDAYLIEQSILSKYVDARIYTKWSTELFKYDVLSGSINNEV